MKSSCFFRAFILCRFPTYFFGVWKSARKFGDANLSGLAERHGALNGLQESKTLDDVSNANLVEKDAELLEDALVELNK